MTTRYLDPNDLLRDLLLAYPKASEKDILERFTESLRDNPRCEDAIRTYWFANHFRRFEVVQPAPHSTTVQLRERLERRQVERKKIERVKEALHSALTLGFVMPNGSELRHCTIEYVELEGGKIAAIAQTARMRGGHSNQQIGKFVTDTDLTRLRPRKVA